MSIQRTDQFIKQLEETIKRNQDAPTNTIKAWQLLLQQYKEMKVMHINEIIKYLETEIQNHQQYLDADYSETTDNERNFYRGTISAQKEILKLLKEGGK